MPATIWGKFFWSDYQSDTALRMCSLASQGLWMRMLCVMAQAKPLGHLTVGGKQVSVDDLAAIAGRPVEEIKPLLVELEERGVFSRNKAGSIFNRRMNRAGIVSESRANSARKRWGSRGDDPSGGGGENLNAVNGFGVLHMQTECKADARGHAKPMQRSGSSQNPDKEEKKESLSRTQYSECARGQGEVDIQPGGEPVPRRALPVSVLDLPPPPPTPIPEPAPMPPPAPPLPAAARPSGRAPPMPRRSSPPHQWILLAGNETMLEDRPTKGGVVNGVFLHEAAELVCQAARIEDQDFRCDWRPLKAWLADGFDLATCILPAIAWKAKREDYEPVHSLAAFDGLIRKWRTERLG